MTGNIFTTVGRWLLVLPAAFVASGTSAWLFSFLANLTHTINVVAAANTIEQHFYVIAANFVYGWVFVSAGTATAPGHRSAVSVVLVFVLLTAMGFVAYNGSLMLDGFLATMWAVLRVVGYVAGAAVAVWMIVAAQQRVASAIA
jgi:hypothetical protein